MQPPGGRGWAFETAADRQEVEPVLLGAGDDRSRETGVGPSVGVEGDDPLTRGGVDPLLKRPCLAGPAGGKGVSCDHRGAGSAGDRSGRIGRLIVDDDHLGDAGPADDLFEQRADPVGFVPGRDDHADRGRDGLVG